jgi:hypothetical protein
LGGTDGVICDPSKTSITSDIVCYTVRAQDINGAGNVTATANYTNGTSHNSGADSPGVVSGSQGTANHVSPCSVDRFCSRDICDPTIVFGDLGERLGTCRTVDISATQCPPDAFFCATNACDEAQDKCVQTDISDQKCPADAFFCATNVCDEAQDKCVQTDISDQKCPADAFFCADNACSEAQDRCVQTDKSATVCPPDAFFCADNACSEAQDKCVQTDKSATVCPPDAYFCATNECSEAQDQCVQTDISDTKCPDDPNNVCEDNTCNEDQNACVVIPANPLPTSCGVAICRTPGFWGTHAGIEKTRSENITAEVIAAGGGVLNICGERIDSPGCNAAQAAIGDCDTAINDAASSTEAICVPVKGAQLLQLARQLTAAALNCIISGGGADCQGTTLYATVFKNCNDNCLTMTKEQMTACIAELDCLNNGNNFDGGICTPGEPGNNCHDRLLVNEDLNLNFEPPGPAGSSDACNAAIDTKCTVVGPLEGPGPGKCAADSLP